jgi:hypothetical protein
MMGTYQREKRPRWPVHSVGNRKTFDSRHSSVRQSKSGLMQHLTVRLGYVDYEPSQGTKDFGQDDVQCHAASWADRGTISALTTQ